MANLDLTSSSKHHTPRLQWRFLDFVSLIFFASIFLFFILVLTPLGDSIAATGSQALITSTTGATRRHHLIALIESGRNPRIQPCSSDSVDYMPCEDPNRNRLLSRDMNYYRERHCPPPEERQLCLIPPPEGYNIPIQWPNSLYKIWHGNMPYNKIADRKGHQGWMKKEGPHFIFPGGGTMFPDGAVKYIEQLEQYIPISGAVLRTVLDMGCGKKKIGSCSEIGPKPYMEDEFICIDDLQQHLDAKSVHPSAGAFYGVFDGHGGVDVASFTKRNILEFIVEDSDFPNGVKKAVMNAFTKADHALADTDTRSLDNSSGTTALTLLFLKLVMKDKGFIDLGCVMVVFFYSKRFEKS